MGTFTVSVNLVHMNEVFNSFSHSYVATFVIYNQNYDELLFDTYSLNSEVAAYFAENINTAINYQYQLNYFYDEEEVTHENTVNNFTITLKGDVGFFVEYEKTFRYYIVRWRS
ncbi:MAG TPA: hypothetical protein VFD05_04600 [Bacilli bacterium]|nr:hypothetical protein [Bacilli bacterium]